MVSLVSHTTFDDQSSAPPSILFRRVRVLGEGSYGVVFLAINLKPDINGLHDQQIAVKTANIDYASSLMKEKRIFEAFQGCPEIVHCYSDMKTIECGIKLYNLLLEFAPAGTLRDLIRATGGIGLPEKDVRVYARMILSGLECMHAKGYVHCDLKPENILAFPCRDNNGTAYHQLKLADFGLVKEPEEELLRESWKGRFRGTPHYMSPESVGEGIISPALDIWSFGCTVAQMITGWKSPWPGLEDYMSSPEDFGYCLAGSSMRPRIPPFMSEIGKDFLRMCLERDPMKRWSAEILLLHPFVAETASSDQCNLDASPPLDMNSLLPRGLLSS